MNQPRKRVPEQVPFFDDHFPVFGSGIHIIADTALSRDLKQSFQPCRFDTENDLGDVLTCNDKFADELFDMFDQPLCI